MSSLNTPQNFLNLAKIVITRYFSRNNMLHLFERVELDDLVQEAALYWLQAPAYDPEQSDETSHTVSVILHSTKQFLERKLTGLGMERGMNDQRSGLKNAIELASSDQEIDSFQRELDALQAIFVYPDGMERKDSPEDDLVDTAWDVFTRSSVFAEELIEQVELNLDISREVFRLLDAQVASQVLMRYGLWDENEAGYSLAELASMENTTDKAISNRIQRALRVLSRSVKLRELYELNCKSPRNLDCYLMEDLFRG